MLEIKNQHKNDLLRDSLAQKNEEIRIYMLKMS